ncbi:MAG: pyridoxamine 5'-phosphate oxidase family protein [Hydrogenophaga sp.]|uniref:pyridoxamine 5'-phosphate oxidase family protein n=1 Tax=Hydrogenophaga sp. TaxID=1904254 RepID=UPI001D8CB67A|nr:pyridoxamine 5'-phosphate oxidase family protein [Hydrogenophaga sp.]MBX3608541.1 pyridoxamine 5'-phosphate oxidase family protein [Hydrogenophaga sp.]
MAIPTFHSGERSLQQRVGVEERLAAIGPQVVRDHMPDQHRELFGKLPTLIVGSLDERGQAWASMLVGAPGFLQTPDAWHMRVQASVSADDPLAGALRVGAPLGLLGIEPHTRRRNRMNGQVSAVEDHGFSLRVVQSFGNCPKYIQARSPDWVDRTPLPAHTLGSTLAGEARELLARADTVFIASAAPGAGMAGTTPDQGVDVSHRGGPPGFLRLRDDAEGTTITLPDYRGNFFFNTLGNLLERPEAGLLCVDPDSGDVLQIAVSARLDWDADLSDWPGAERLIHLRVRQHLWRPQAVPLRWSAPEPAPQFAGFKTAVPGPTVPAG